MRLCFGNRITGGCFLDRAFEMLMYNPEERYLPMGMRVKERCRILATHGIWYKEMDEEDTHSIGRSSQNMLINVHTENKKGSIRNLKGFLVLYYTSKGFVRTNETSKEFSIM